MERAMRLVSYFFAMVSLSLFLGAAHAQQLSETIRLRLGIATGPFKISDKPFTTVRIGDARIVDISAQANVMSNREVDLVPLAPGHTNILFFDERGALIKDLGVIVDDGALGPTRIHNKALVSSFTSYRCWPTGCQQSGEKTVDEPVRLPSTVTRTQTDSLYQGVSGVGTSRSQSVTVSPTVTVSPPPAVTISPPP
jgi:hypothetical protein